jgi:hypothetical protein
VAQRVNTARQGNDAPALSEEIAPQSA